MLGSSTRGKVLFELFHNSTDHYRHPSMDHRIPKTTVDKVHQGLARTTEIKFRYMFVRDPLSRAMSAYTDRVVKKGKHEGGRNLSLSKFFTSTLMNSSTTDQHFLTQINVCNPCKLNLTFLGRLETMDEDLDYIVNKGTKLHDVINFKVNKTKQILNKSVLSSDRLETLSLEVLFKFIWYFRHDYLAFGYNPYRTVLKLYDMYPMKKGKPVRRWKQG